MGFLIVVALFAVSSWAVFATVRRLRRTKASQVWWFAFASLVLIGLVAGCWLAFSFEYQVSPRMRYSSFPMPLAFFHLEDGRWVDFVTPPHVMYPGLVANVIAVVAMALLPLSLTSLAFGRTHSDETGTAP